MAQSTGGTAPPAGSATAPAGGTTTPVATTAPAVTPTPAAAPRPIPREVRIALSATAMVVEGTQEASAQVFTDGGTRMTAGFDLSWRSSNAGVLSVDGSGAVSGRGAGTAWLVASAGDARDSVLVAVAAVVAAVEIEESDFALEVGGSRGLNASATDENGTRLERDIAWSSSNPAAVVVDAGTGRVTARGEGTAQVTATADGSSDAVTVSVAALAAALPTADEASTAIDGYMAALTGGDEDAVRRYWSTADEDGLDDLLDLIGERGFSATLGAVGDPSEQGGGAEIMFSVDAEYRSFAGGGRSETLNFVGRLEPAGSNWVLVSAVVR